MKSVTFQQLLVHLSNDFPHYTFIAGGTFAWLPHKKQIIYQTTKPPTGIWLLLHELAHAQLGHIEYEMDIELLKYESQAWQYAQRTLATKYGATIADHYVQDCLEGYRDWLYTRSICPACHQTGLQTKKNTYSCINCRYSWYVNDARQCSLRRTRLRDQARSALEYSESL